MAFKIDDGNPFWTKRRDYFLSIGLPEDRLARYFNAGVIFIRLRSLALAE